MEKRFRVLVERNYKSLAEYNKDAVKIKIKRMDPNLFHT